ncbi:MAG: TonB-dependent receptor [Sedimentisphaerales bacterium]|nr:TonB-dependent receptor [Sedimentisphaerales bacterium]
MVDKLLSFGWRFVIVAVMVYSSPIFAGEAEEEKATLVENETANKKDTSSGQEVDLFDMSIEQLMEMEVASTATLTESKPRLVPAAVTTVTEEQIQASGARSLFELLDIYVPNLQWVRNTWEAENMGLRGIMTDRDDKYLLLVNGRVMNERTHYGVVSERDLVLLKDIHHIDIVRGPGSALYGPGAVSMVINIVTHNAGTFQGTEITSRLGAVEEFYSTEIRHGHKFDDGDGGFFGYAGIGEYRGADKFDAPLIVTRDLTGMADMAIPAAGTLEGDPLLHPSIPNDGEAYRNLPPLKFYGEITRGSWDFWARYTRGGKQFPWDPQMLTSDPYGWGGAWILPYVDPGYGYQQATTYIGRLTELGERTNLDLSLSYDMFDFERQVHTWILEAFREEKYIGKAVIRHNIHEKHKLAFGTEVLHGEYGNRSPGWPHSETVISQIGSPVPQWSTNMYSVFGEYQWNINKQWTTFLGGRIDDHTYTKQMLSPRATLVFTPTEKDTYKLMWARSVRANYEEQLKLAAEGDSRPEKLDSIELRYERTHSKNLDLAATGFVHYNLELIGWDGTSMQTVPIATQRDWGFELEAAYHTDNTRVAVSHGYTKLYSFNLEPGAWSYVSAKDFGYGDDLARWSNHITKLTAQHKLDDQWKLDGSMRVYWGFPGHKDFSHYVHDAYASGGWPDSLAAEGWQRSYRTASYLNLGLQHHPSKNLTLRVDGYYLLGIFNKDFNKRIYGGNNPFYRSHAPAVALSMIYKF